MVDLVRVNCDVRFEPRCAVCNSRILWMKEALIGYVPGSLPQMKVFGLFHIDCVVTDSGDYPRFAGLSTSESWSCGVEDCRSGGSHWDRRSAQRCIDANAAKRRREKYEDEMFLDDATKLRIVEDLLGGVPWSGVVKKYGRPLTRLTPVLVDMKSKYLDKEWEVTLPAMRKDKDTWLVRARDFYGSE